MNSSFLCSNIAWIAHCFGLRQVRNAVSVVFNS